MRKNVVTNGAETTIIFAKTYFTEKEIREIEVGEVLKVIATDVGTKKDFPSLAKRTGIEIVEMVEEEDKIIWYLRRTE